MIVRWLKPSRRISGQMGAAHHDACELLTRADATSEIPWASRSNTSTQATQQPTP